MGLAGLDYSGRKAPHGIAMKTIDSDSLQSHASNRLKNTLNLQMLNKDSAGTLGDNLRDASLTGVARGRERSALECFSPTQVRPKGQLDPSRTLGLEEVAQLQSRKQKSKLGHPARRLTQIINPEERLMSNKKFINVADLAQGSRDSSPAASAR